jgi:hypothetical protein
MRPGRRSELFGVTKGELPQQDLQHCGGVQRRTAGAFRRSGQIQLLTPSAPALIPAITDASSQPGSPCPTEPSRTGTTPGLTTTRRRRRPLTSRTWHTETVYAITDMTWRDIRADQITEAIRRHWGIENRLHWIRDVVFAEDHSQIRTGAGPVVMATLCNLAVSLHRLTGALNIVAACRHVSRHPNRVLPLLT